MYADRTCTKNPSHIVTQSTYDTVHKLSLPSHSCTCSPTDMPQIDLYGLQFPFLVHEQSMASSAHE